MATQTTNYGLTKPSYNETADIGVINSNMDIIDAKMKAIENKAGSGGGSGNTDTYGHVKVGSVTIDASGDDTIELVAGSNVTLTPDTTSKSVTISATGGGGTSVTVDSELSTTSENPVQNKVITQALNEKGTYSKPTGGIPKTDLASEVQASLENADNVSTLATEVDSLSSTIDNQNSYGYLGGNLLQFNNGIAYPFTRNGITFSKDNRGVITINGNTSSEYGYVDLMAINGMSGTYKISGIDLIGKGSMYVYCIDDSSFPITIESGEGEVTFDSTKQYLISLNVYPNTAVSNAKVYPMLRLVTDTDSTYRPYSKSNVELTNEKANNDIISDAWDASTIYEVGQYCIYNNSLWKCLVQHSGQTPTEGTYWTKVTVANEITSVNNSLEWKLVGSANSDGTITLPTNYKEIKFVTIYTHDSNSCGLISGILSKEDIDNCTSNDIISGNGYYDTPTDMINRQFRITKDANTIKCLTFYWANGNVVSKTISYLYYR